MKSILTLLLFTTSMMMATAQNRQQTEHLVFVKFKSETPEAKIEEFNQRFAALKKAIPLIRKFELQRNNSPEKLDKGFQHLYKITFADGKARDSYLVHPEHVKFVAYVQEVAIIEDIMVFDY